MSDERIYRSVANETALPLTSIAELHVRLIDTVKGYQTMMEKAEPELQKSITPFATLHQRHADELAAILRDNGISADQDGSYMSTVHQLVISTRAMFADLDSDALPAVLSGEETIIAAYKDALAEAHDATNNKANDSSFGMVDCLISHIDELTLLVRQTQAQTHA